MDKRHASLLEKILTVKGGVSTQMQIEGVDSLGVCFRGLPGFPHINRTLLLLLERYRIILRSVLLETARILRASEGETDAVRR